MSVAKAVFSTDGSTWIVNDGKLVELDGSAGYREASIGQAFKQVFAFSITNKFALIARGSSAGTRLSTSPPALFTRHKPSEIGIVRFTVQADRDRRYVWVVSRVGSNEGEFYPPEANVPLNSEKQHDGIYKVVPRSALAPGEYALVAPGGTTGYLVYEFGID